MWKFIQRNYYEWVIRNCVRDIRELKDYVKTAGPCMSMSEEFQIQHEINEARRDMDNARNKLSQLNA